jgi:hypothetical protein
MSGYLRRLASSARSPGQSIHPAVRSLFSAPQQDAVLPILEEDNVTTVNKPESLPARAQDEPQVLVHESSSTLSQEPNASPEMMAPKREALEASAIRIVKEPLREEQPLLERPEPDRQPNAPKPTAIPTHVYQPLIAESVGRKVGQQSTVLKGLSPLSDRTARSEREPDEIQIHIGRIEVTAVPPPVSRPQTKPARKSLSLDEYLKRGRR